MPYRPVCNPCWFQEHDGCDNTAVSETGGATSCFCACWEDHESEE